MISARVSTKHGKNEAWWKGEDDRPVGWRELM
jgi:hypothetical protein